MSEEAIFVVNDNLFSYIFNPIYRSEIMLMFIFKTRLTLMSAWFYYNRHIFQFKVALYGPFLFQLCQCRVGCPGPFPGRP